MREGGDQEILWSGRQRGEKVDKRQEVHEPTRFYHVTTHKFKVGEAITPDEESNRVFLADKPLPHTTICERVLPDPEMRQVRVANGSWREEWDGKWYTYEVEPIGPIEYGAENDELLCQTAEVIRFVGDARAILKKHILKLEKHGKNPNGVYGTSRVYGVENIRGHKVRGRGRDYWQHSALEYRRKGGK